MAGGVERPGAGGGGGARRRVGRGRRPDRAGPGGRGLDPAVGHVVPLALGRRFYPSRGIGPIGSGGHGAGVAGVSAGPAAASPDGWGGAARGGRRGWRAPSGGAWPPPGPGRTGWARARPCRRSCRPLALGWRFYPSRGIGPIGVGWSRRGCGRGVCWPGGRRVAGGVERPGAGGGSDPRRRVGRGRRPARAGPGGVEGAPDRGCGAAATGDRGESPGANFPAGSEVSLVFLFRFRAFLALGRVLHEEPARLGGDDEPILVGVDPIEHRLGALELLAADLAVTVLVHRA